MGEVYKNNFTTSRVQMMLFRRCLTEASPPTLGGWIQRGRRATCFMCQGSLLMYPYIVATYMVSVYPHWIIVHVTNLSDAAIIFRYFNPPIFNNNNESRLDSASSKLLLLTSERRIYCAQIEKDFETLSSSLPVSFVFHLTTKFKFLTA